MAYQRLLEDCMDNPPGYRMSPIPIDKKVWLDNYENQINDLKLLLDKDTTIIRKNNRLLLNYKDKIIFRIEHLKAIKKEENEGEEDLLELNTQYENNVYIESLGDDFTSSSLILDSDVSSIPVYTEKADSEESRVLGNFWISFTEYGLPHILDSFQSK